MKKRSLLVLCVVLAFASTPAFTQNANPLADGKIGPSEYAASRTDGKITIYWTVASDTIYMAVSAPTSGWVAVGLGSSRMNGATIFMGYVDENGNPMVTVQKGRSHTHSPTSDVTPVAEVVGSANGTTVLEIAVRRSEVTQPGASRLDYIYAYSTAKNFRTRHVFRNASSLSL